MTSEQAPVRTADPGALAAAGRSILSCPDDVQLVVDGVDDINEGLDAEVPGEEPTLEMQEVHGQPTFACPPGSALARAAAERRSALLTLSSGLGQPGSPDRETTLTMAGKLDATDLDECTCCAQLRTRVTLTPDFVLLSRTGVDAGAERRLRVPLRNFRSRAHGLNRGFLQRATEHANTTHQDELRRSVLMLTGTRLGDIGGVALTDLRPDQVEVRWIDTSGAHRTVLHFDRPARTPQELGALLREQLHGGLC